MNAVSIIGKHREQIGLALESIDEERDAILRKLAEVDSRRDVLIELENRLRIIADEIKSYLDGPEPTLPAPMPPGNHKDSLEAAKARQQRSDR